MGDLVECIGYVVEVARVEASDGDAAIHGHVDGVLLSELINLVFVEAGEGEHADLVGHVLPVVLVAERLQFVDKARSHGSHASGHIFQILMPHGGQLRVAQDDVDDSSSVNGRVGVDWSGNLLDAGHDNCFLFFASADNGEGSNSLTVETEVLSERLEEDEVVGVLLEEAERVSVLLEVT